jgi:WD40 repeat protein
MNRRPSGDSITRLARLPGGRADPDNARVDEPRYWAFISYSHADEKWARWLQRSLERYPIPKSLRGRVTAHGSVPRRLFPVFRDRDELRAAADLSKELEKALRGARALIVLCSPRAVTSPWIDQEIRRFKALGHEERVHCLLVGGGEEDAPKDVSEWMPTALRYRVDADGRLTGERAEPLAADARPEGDGKAGACLKLIAGILGVEYDELKRRDAQWRRRRRRVRLAAAAVLAATLGLLTAEVVSSRGEIEKRGEEARRAGEEAVAKGALAATATEDAARKGRVAEANRLAFAAQSRLAAGRPQLGLLLACAGLKVSLDAGEPVTQASEQAARDALRSIGGRALAGHRDNVPFDALAFSEDGRFLVSGAADGAVIVWDLRAPDPSAAKERLRHVGPVRDVVVSVDGGLVVAAGVKGVLYAWEGAPPRAPREVARIRGGFSGLALSPDGRWLLATCEDSAARLWRTDRLDESPSVLPHPGTVTTGAFSPDGRWLATACARGGGANWKEGKTFLWDVTDGHPPRTPQDLGETTPVTALAFARRKGATLLAAATVLRRVRTWSREGASGAWEPGQELTVSDTPDPGLAFLALSRSGRWVLCGSAAGDAEVWDLANPQSPERHVLPKVAGGVYSVAISPDEESMALGGHAPRLFALPATSGSEEPLELPGHEGIVTSVAFSPDGRWLATAGAGGQVRLWDRRGEPTAQCDLLPEVANGGSLALTPDGRCLAAAGGVPRLWRLDDGPASAHAVPLPDVVDARRALALSPLGDALLVGGDDGTTEVWTLSPPESPPRRTPLPTHEGRVLAAAFSPDGRWMAAAGEGGYALLWSVVDGKVAGNPPRVVRPRPEDAPAGNSRFGTPKAAFEVLAFSPDSRLLATGRADGEVCLWGLSTPAPAPRSLDLNHNGNLTGLVFSADGRWLVSTGTDRTAVVWDVGQPARSPVVLRRHTGWVHCAAVSPDGRWVVTGGGHVVENGMDTARSDSRALVWRLAAPEALPQALTGHVGWVRAVRFDRSGTRLFTLGDDGVRLWRVSEAGVEDAPVFLKRTGLAAMELTGDGRFLVTQGKGRIAFWPLDPKAILARARVALGRNWNPAEWDEHFPGTEYRPLFEGVGDD